MLLSLLSLFPGAFAAGKKTGLACFGMKIGWSMPTYFHPHGWPEGSWRLLLFVRHILSFHGL